jgi:hypothetical protein
MLYSIVDKFKNKKNMFASFIINPIAILISISTAAGVFVHDMKIDKMTLTALALPAVIASYEASSKFAGLSPDLHTHAERSSLSQVVNDLKAQNPRIQPRTNEDKKHLMQKHAARGYHAFDSYRLPIA